MAQERPGTKAPEHFAGDASADADLRGFEIYQGGQHPLLPVQRCGSDAEQKQKLVGWKGEESDGQILKSGKTSG